MVKQATFCSEQCLKELQRSSQYTPKELECLDNCVEKLFVTEKLLKGYMVTKFSKLTEKEIVSRLNNPTDSYGKYFTH